MLQGASCPASRSRQRRTTRSALTRLNRFSAVLRTNLQKLFAKSARSVSDQLMSRGDGGPADFPPMAIDLKTLFLLTVDVEAMLGLLLLLVWIQRRATPA